MKYKSTIKLHCILGFLFIANCQLALAIHVEEKSNESKSVSVPNVACYIDLDIRDCPIQLGEYVDQAQRLLTTLKYIDAGGRKQVFTEIQAETVTYQSVIDAINNSINTNDCVIAGIRIFNTLEINTGSIILYFAPVYASKPSTTGKYFDFLFNDSSGELSGVLMSKSSAVYKVENGKLSDISTNQLEVELAIERWNNYKKNIQIDWLIRVGDRSFKDGSDINSVFYPLEEIKVLQESAAGQANVIVSSAVKKYNNSYIHTINLGNTIPDRGTYPNRSVPTTGPEVSYFMGMAANMGQLCPTSCSRLRAIKVSENTYKLSN